ncbi:MAG: fibronectin-binding protein (FBP) [Bacteroidetes bacterium]|nr:fibronectin-binding protein (FBP) [Bacteroidota bacterium]
MENKIDWSKKNNAKINNEEISGDLIEDIPNLRKKIEPWLSAIFQSEHLSLLIGSGLTTSVSYQAGTVSTTMGRLDITNTLSDKIKEAAKLSAEKMGRGEPNLEDDLRAAYELLAGLKILNDSREGSLASEVETKLLEFINSILKTEADFIDKLINQKTTEAQDALLYLKTFLLSFSSRAASRERLNLFTTNYDRFIEYGCDDSGIIVLDRFKGKILPIFRTTKLELDYHYNPPGIRGEPRYVEGVVRLTKLHGSVDWRFMNNRIVRCPLPFGAKAISDSIPHPEVPKNPRESVVIYPNSAKDIETAFYPYAELFEIFNFNLQTKFSYCNLWI